MRYFISVDYNEPNPNEYHRVNCSEAFSDNKRVYDSGDFGKDWFDMVRDVITLTEDESFSAVFSSSVDHFFMDGAKFDSTFLCFNSVDGPYLDYNVDSGIELFVPEGTKPTWKELKELYNDKK